MAFDGVIFGLIVGFLRRGSLRGFLDVRLKYGWMFPILLVVQLVMYRLQNQYDWAASMSTYMFMLVYIIGFVFLWLNRKERGFIILMIGAFLNFLVMLVNGGRMPVSLEAAQAVLDPFYAETLRSGVVYGKHVALTSSTHLAFLGDIIPLTKPYYKEQVISIGDVVMGIGIFLYIQKVMLSFKRDQQTTVQPVEQI
jgi:uncharacterized membrane protein (Fun14 family)